MPITKLIVICDDTLFTSPLVTRIVEQMIGDKLVKVELRTGKPPVQMTLEDYDRATTRAVFKAAGYGMLSEAELETVRGILPTDKVWEKNTSFELANLRREDAKPGATFVTTNQLAIENAKRVGQAVLQYQEYQAKRSDAKQEENRSKTNQMLLDPLRLGGNAPFRWTERILNTPRDILRQRVALRPPILDSS